MVSTDDMYGSLDSSLVTLVIMLAKQKKIWHGILKKKNFRAKHQLPFLQKCLIIIIFILIFI